MSAANLRTATPSPTRLQDYIIEAPRLNVPSSKTGTPLYSRRSVSSMKGLLPLTLSTSCSSSRSYLPLEEGMEDRVDEYFPEVLARDLELCKAVFESRSMTAGSPISATTPDYMMKSRAVVFPGRLSMTSPYHTASARVQSLGAIEERSSIVSFLDQRDQALKSDDAMSDLSSLTGTDASDSHMPPSFRTREQSIVTAATSLTSSSNWRPSSSKGSPSPDLLRQECSWIEGDSDGEDENDVSDESVERSLSPRPPTPRVRDDELEASLESQIHVSRYGNGILHRKSHSVSGGTPLPSIRRHSSGRSMTDSWRPASVQSRRRQDITLIHPSSPLDIDSFPPSIKSHRPSTSYTRSMSMASQPAKLNTNLSFHSRGSSTTKVPSKISIADMDMDMDDDSLASPIEPTARSKPRSGSIFVRPTPPPSPLPSVQTWLNGNTSPCPISFGSEDLAKVVPLPPDVIETLRVSTACFPETMLLSSSLTVETIRTYSKKMRQPSVDYSRMSPPQSPVHGTRKSIWRRVVKKGSLSGQTPRGAQGSSNLQSASSVSIESPKPWAPIKNVFGSCSDYICDALYAHIVAYNYISALVARNPAPAASARTRTSGGESQHEDIPKKAASLLGLSQMPNIGAASGPNRLTKRRSTSLPSWAREEMITSQPATSANHDVAIRAIQGELLRCISRLMATARLMAESGSVEETVVEMNAEEPDKLFMRSLCEIVRISEEAS